MFWYDDFMQKHLDHPEIRKKLSAMKRRPIDEIKVDLAGFSASLQGSGRALRGSLFRAWYRKTKRAERVPLIQGSDFNPVINNNDEGPDEFTRLDRYIGRAQEWTRSKLS